jgi:hypothetical protein
VVVVDTSATPTRVPVLGDREDSARMAVGQRVVQVGGVPHGVVGLGAVDEPLGRRRDLNLEGRPGGYRRPVLVEDRPFLFFRALVPDAYVVSVGSGTSAPLIGGQRDEDDGVRVAVNARVAEVCVVAAAVPVRGAVDERGIVGIGVVGIVSRLLYAGAFERTGLGWATGVARDSLSPPTPTTNAAAAPMATAANNIRKAPTTYAEYFSGGESPLKRSVTPRIGKPSPRPLTARLSYPLSKVKPGTFAGVRLFFQQRRRGVLGSSACLHGNASTLCQWYHSRGRKGLTRSAQAGGRSRGICTPECPR